jgi:Protein of unknown function (DUF3455)
MTFSATALAARTVASVLAVAGVCLTVELNAARAQPSLPPEIEAPGTVAVMTAHAVGAQIYECAADAAGKPGWRFREPIASLMVDGRTVGRHFAGPGWELADGSFVVGKVAGRSAGTTGDDIPWLKLEGSAGRGQFANVTVVQRINTKGGTLAGACGKEGEMSAVPYSADYVFLAKGG